jgi:choline dehydrogenase-like flavoprotein
MNRPNLHILVSAHVTRVLTKAGVDGVEATGVEFIHNGETSSVFATREVILAAG